MFNVDGIETAFREGCRLHAFLSGGGLRVVSLKDSMRERGYGEHPHIEDALVHLNEDFLAGGRRYSDVYGGKYPHYLTGSSTSSTELDNWVRQGRTFDAWREGDEVVVELHGYGYETTPTKIREDAKDGPITWTSERGFVLETSMTKFANGEDGISTRMISVPDGKTQHSCWMYRITKTGRGRDLWTAIDAAFEAPEVERDEAIP